MLNSLKTILFSHCLTFFLFSQVYAQRTNVGVSLKYMADYNWYKPLQDFQHPLLLSNVNIQSRLPLCFTLQIERQFSEISPSFGINFIQRNLVYSQNYTNLVSFSHQTLELPVCLTKRKNIGDDADFLLSAGGGISYILTPTKKTQTGLLNNDTLVYEFSVVNPNKVNGFINAGIGIENKIGNAGSLQIKIQYVYYIMPLLKYTAFNNGFIQTTNPFRNNYASIGVTYFPSFLKSKKSHDQTRQQ